MNAELPTRYDPRKIEQQVYEFWRCGGYFHTEPDRPGEPYTIVIPPPNVTGALHMGHALNNTLQDILIRWRRMQGYNTLWMPGTDHAGIATQNVVEQELARQGVHRRDLGREGFVERVWEWKRKYGGRIVNQLKRLGASCDWQRERFTMDEGLSNAVLETFVELYKRGLIYRGKYIINWCPRCRTALSDDEVEHEEHEGHLWYIRYPFRDDPHAHIAVATTRPETMLGDTAVAVHPDDERFREHVGKTLVLPVIGRELPIIADAWVDPQFGTGAVKVTPAHDPNDFDLSRRHDLAAVVVIDEDGAMTRQAGEQYEGMDRFECREALVEDLHERGLLERVEPYVHSVGHCYRCHTVIEPYLSDQWFVKMKPLARKAMRAVRDGRISFHPQRWTDFYLSWLENVRDWCISRQIWWGHRLPVYYCEQCGGIAVERRRPRACPHCGSQELRQDEDVLDTWFSSALWPFSTLGWPEITPELERYYPTNTLVTDRGIIYFWVARMVMMGLEFMGDIPFTDVYIHGTILDELGRKMSKSLGNGIDPIEMIEAYGADAVRFSLVMLTAEGQDVKLSPSKFEMGRNFANKVWNAARFVLMNLAGEAGEESLERARMAELRKFEDRWILSRLDATVESVTGSLERFRTNEAAQAIYAFFWHEFCDWYVEMTKGRLEGDPEDAAVARATLAEVLDVSLRLLHPFAPYLTEKIWQELKRLVGNGAGTPDAAADQALIVARWPAVRAELRNAAIEREMTLIQELVRGIRNVRKEKGLPQRRLARVTFSCPDAQTAQALESHRGLLAQMALLEDIEAGVALARPPRCATSVVGAIELFLHLEGLIDVEEERKRLLEQRTDVEDYLDKVRKKLNNPGFLANAPEHVVQQQMDKEKELQERLQKISRNIAELS